MTTVTFQIPTAADLGLFTHIIKRHFGEVAMHIVIDHQPLAMLTEAQQMDLDLEQFQQHGLPAFVAPWDAKTEEDW